MVNWEKIQKKVLETDKNVLRTVVKSCDGHSIFSPQHFLKQGFEFIARLGQVEVILVLE